MRPHASHPPRKDKVRPSRDIPPHEMCHSPLTSHPILMCHSLCNAWRWWQQSTLAFGAHVCQDKNWSAAETTQELNPQNIQLTWWFQKFAWLYSVGWHVCLAWLYNVGWHVCHVGVLKKIDVAQKSASNLLNTLEFTGPNSGFNQKHKTMVVWKTVSSLWRPFMTTNAEEYMYPSCTFQVFRNVKICFRFRCTETDSPIPFGLPVFKLFVFPLELCEWNYQVLGAISPGWLILRMLTNNEFVISLVYDKGVTPKLRKDRAWVPVVQGTVNVTHPWHHHSVQSNTSAEKQQTTNSISVFWRIKTITQIVKLTETNLYFGDKEKMFAGTKRISSS